MSSLGLDRAIEGGGTLIVAALAPRSCGTCGLMELSEVGCELDEAGGTTIGAADIPFMANDVKTIKQALV